MWFPQRFSSGDVAAGLDRALRMLIINADDWGYDAHTTTRALTCVERGSISSVSAMVFMEDSERAAAVARDRGIDAGLHLNLDTPFSKVPMTAATWRNTKPGSRVSFIVRSHARFSTPGWFAHSNMSCHPNWLSTNVCTARHRDGSTDTTICTWLQTCFLAGCSLAVRYCGRIFLGNPERSEFATLFSGTTQN